MSLQKYEKSTDVSPTTVDICVHCVYAVIMCIMGHILNIRQTYFHSKIHECSFSVSHF